MQFTQPRGHSVSGKNKPVTVPSDLSTLSDEDLSALREAATAEFDEINGQDKLDADGMKRLTQLATDIKRIDATVKANAESAAEAKAQREALAADVHASDQKEEEPVAEPEPAAAPQPEPVLAATAPAKTDVRDVLRPAQRSLNESLRRRSLNDAQQLVPVTADFGPRNPMEGLVAAGDVPSAPMGSPLSTMDALVAAMTSRAKVAATTRLGDNAPRHRVATLNRQFRHTVDSDETNIDEMWRTIQAASDPAELVAAGGWCSPSEISYDFFNIVCEDGTYDLPTMGVRRGGIRWPISPSFGDLSAITGLWSWTETQDIAAATGTAQSGTKTCSRIPCATFDERRLACDGICITAGNLTTDAWPELIANYMRLVNAAHYHRVNAQIIQQVVALANYTASYATTGVGFVTPTLDILELQAFDYREKFAMCEGAVLEVVMPRWAIGAMRADLAKRNGAANMMAASNNQLADWLDTRGLRVQFVGDWQVRASGYPGFTNGTIASWPSTMQMLMYSPGTVVKGTGLTLDLGIVRDSVLNATNDYTAAWSEECWLIARIGHEVRSITVPVCPNGALSLDVVGACATP